MTYDQIIEERRKLSIPGYCTLAEVGFDDQWITPYQKLSHSPTGPVLVALHWLDEWSIKRHQEILHKLGYLPCIRFNRVLDEALAARALRRSDIYVTQAFHPIPREDHRSESIPPKLIKRSFDAITRHELVGRRVLALGSDAAKACKRYRQEFEDFKECCHPSRRGFTNIKNAEQIASALQALGY